MPKYTKRQGGGYSPPAIVPIPPKNSYLAPSESLFSPADVVLDTIEVKPTEQEAVEKAKKARLQCKEVGFLLQKRGSNRKLESALFRAGQKIENCAIFSAYQSLSAEVNYKTGTALCKNRLCPNCQRILSAKRKANFLDWFELNRPVMKKYFFYHLVLTVRHDAATGLRNNLYTSDLLEYFGQLRGSVRTPGWRERKIWWEAKVAGGVYSTEVKPGSDSSPHIHIHVLLIGKGQLWNRIKESEFKKRALAEWRQITGDPKSVGVFIEPVYYLNQSGDRVNCHFGSTVNVEQGVAECMKYTLKSDVNSLQGYSDTFLNELLTIRNRYYGRFGMLTPKHPDSKLLTRLDMLCTDYKDLEQMSRVELSRLFDPESGEVKTIEDTKIVITPIRNVRAHQAPLRLRDGQGNLLEHVRGQTPIGGEVYYSLVDSSLWSVVAYNHDEHALARRTLSRTLKRNYDSSNDIV